MPVGDAKLAGHRLGHTYHTPAALFHRGRCGNVRSTLRGDTQVTRRRIANLRPVRVILKPRALESRSRYVWGARLCPAFASSCVPTDAQSLVGPPPRLRPGCWPVSRVGATLGSVQSPGCRPPSGGPRFLTPPWATCCLSPLLCGHLWTPLSHSENSGRVISIGTHFLSL